MLTFIELWNPNARWMCLSPAQQERFVQRLVQRIEQLDGPGGIEMVGWGSQLPGVQHPLSFQLFAIWRVPTERDLARVQQVLRDVHWYDYVEQRNVAGELLSPPTAFRKYMVGCSPESLKSGAPTLDAAAAP